MSEAPWSELPPSIRLTLSLLALEGGVMQPASLQQQLRLMAERSPQVPKNPVTQGSLVRLAEIYPNWVGHNRNGLVASETLRRIALPTREAALLTAGRYEAEIQGQVVYWAEYGSGFTLLVCWLLAGAPRIAERAYARLPTESMIYRALEWILPPGHDPALYERLPSPIKRLWLFRRFATAYYQAGAELPLWRGRLSELDPVDQLALHGLSPVMDDRLLAGLPPRETDQCPDWLLLSNHSIRQCMAQADVAYLDDFEIAIKALRKDKLLWGSLPGLSGLMHWLLLIADQRSASIRRLRSLTRLDSSKVIPADYQRHRRLAALARVWLDGHDLPLKDLEPTDPLGCWLELVLGWWRGLTPTASELAQAAKAVEHARALGWIALAEQLQASIDRCNGIAETDRCFVIDLRERQSDWERTLETLEALASQSVAKEQKASGGRLRVVLRPLSHYGVGHFDLSFSHVPLLRSGEEGRSKSLGTIRSLNSALALWPSESQEASILRAALADANSHRWEELGEAAGRPDSRCLKALIGHPEIYDASGKAVEICEGRPKLTLSGGGEGKVKLSLDPPFDPTVPVSWLQRDARWYRFEPNAQQKLLRGLLDRPQTLPAEALQRLTQAAQGLQPWADLALDGNAGATSVEPQSQPHLLLEWSEGSLLLQARVRPLGREHGPYAIPGKGPRQLLGSVGAMPTVTERDLAAERGATVELLDRLELSVEALEDAGGEWLLAPEAALELLARIEQMEPLPIVAWPRGGGKRVLRGTALKLEVKGGRDWIGVDGGMNLADGSVLAVSRLLGLIRDGESRFVTLDSDRLLLLDSKLRARLAALAPLADGRGQVKLHKLAAPALAAALGDDEQGQAPPLLKELGKRASAFELQPALPRTLQAELRDYQLDGYIWLMRMAAWGAGACLADDMGLGKTVQSLALLCARAGEGPALIVAPTSVLGNWAAEARRFAPELVVHRYEQGTDRDALLAELGASDVLLLSYTLLALDSERLAGRRFATVILDEAQAIKNAATQRAKAACELQADFRLALTGTPIENHLGELWSLMEFLNPGLLGGAQGFSTRFAGPIERNSDDAPAARAALRHLISGFVLRRTKAQVLQELPPRTEITLRIEPGEEEAKLQEAMRLQALERLARNREAPPGARRFSILAELMRLRRGACHPQLYAPELQTDSAKLDQLVELLLELRDNHHRALVFSQFVDYLSLVRARLEAKGLSYQYLDGSTPSKQREGIVAAFQRGEGDCFLLSLKAGGSGLNLTAADYVIHLDPWWNPAVEQQASDRAHRIGQTRPVTVYRLVLADSIEERILALHGAKRELMDSVLAESDGGGALSEEDLLALIVAGQG
jgi:superfamily II DNA or RNA helicase